MNGIFISYRREDSAFVSGLIHERLAEHFGSDAIFTDIDSIPLGVDFKKHIDEQVGKCDIFLAVIGKEWLSATDDNGRPRLENPEDFVRLEIESALKRKRKIPVIPLLVGAVTMPLADELPESLREIAVRNGTPIRPPPTLDSDVERLIKGIDKHLENQAKAEEEEQRQAEAKRKTEEEERRRAEAETKRNAEEEQQRIVLEETRQQEEIRRAEPKRKQDELQREREAKEQQLAEARCEREEERRKVEVEAKRGDKDANGAVTTFWNKWRWQLIGFIVVAVIGGVWIHQAELEFQERQTKAEVERKRQEQARLEEDRRRKAEEEKSQAEIARQNAVQRKAGAVFRDTLMDDSDGPMMVVIPAGSFTMGSTKSEMWPAESEGPQHKVTIIKPFAMSRYEVTFEEFDKFAEATKRNMPYDEGWGRGRQPVINVTWEDAVQYAKWLSGQTGMRYRLPSEAEWEYAARAGTQTDYWWGNDVGRNLANCFSCGSEWDNKRPAPVGSFEPNSFGLYDTAGNVWEMVQDCWNSNYKGAPNDGTAWLSGKCDKTVGRGGSLRNVKDFMRSSYRTQAFKTSKYYSDGIRLARDL